MITYAAVLFDMDGTLSDTEELWLEAEVFIANQFGNGRVSDIAQLAGAPMETVVAHLKERCGVLLGASEIEDVMTERVVSQIGVGFRWRPGAVELLADLRDAGVATALVTASPRVVVDAVVAQLPSGSFDVVVTADDVVMTKPDPEPYLTAARELGVLARECLVIEDSLTGVRAAEAAGCSVVVVPIHVEIPSADRRTVLPTLQGVTAADLHPIQLAKW